jgi:hypothetical protein
MDEQLQVAPEGSVIAPNPLVPQQPAYYQEPQYQPPQYQPQPQYQTPPPAYPQPERSPPGPVKKGGGGSMALAIIGGIIALIGAFMFFMYVTPNDTEFQTLWELLEEAPDAYLYLWLIPILGILAIVLSLIGYAIQSKGAGYATALLGILILVLPLVFAFHLSSDYGTPVQEVFYFASESGMSNGMWQMFLGGFMAMSAGLTVMGAGFGLAGGIGRMKRQMR